MPIDKKKSVGSFFPTSQPSNLTLQPSKISAENISQILEDALEAEDYDRALEAIDAAPRWMQKQPEFMLTRATVLLSQGSEQEALKLLQEIERKNPRLMALYLPLAMLYMTLEWPAHALQAAKRGLSDRNLDKEDQAALDELIQGATAMLQFEANQLGLSFETMQRASIFHEQAQMAMNEGKLSEVERYAKEAIKIAPNWSSPHNNHARALYFSGKTAEAIAISEAVLTRDAENTFALHSLVIYHFGLNQLEKAQEYAARLEKTSKKFPEDDVEIEHLIMALALVEDTPALWKIAKRYLDAPLDTLFGRSWYCLAVAAIRSGKWKDALALLEKAKEELPPNGKRLLINLSEVAYKPRPRLAWMPPAYPKVDVLFYLKVLNEWEFLLKNIKGDELSPTQKRKLDVFFQKYPFMVVAMKCLLWEEDSSKMAAQVLELMENPETDAELLRFALSDTGNSNARLNAISLLIQSGRYSGSQIVNIWNEDREEWREVELNLQRIGEIEVKAQPRTLKLIEKAHKTKNQQEAIALLRQAVEMEPTSPIAIFNLGVMLIESGKDEEGEALARHSVEIDPDYTFGHATIGLIEAGRNHEKEAIDHLDMVTHAKVISPETAVLANLAWEELSIQKHDLKAARQRFEMAAQINPEHRLLEQYKKMLEDAEKLDEDFGYIFDFQRKSAERVHQKLLKTPLTAKMGLHACMETSTKEMLVGSAHFLRTASSGKKGELADWLTECLLDPEFLGQTLGEDLEEREREALKWMLETDGIRPWNEFVRKYGDDMEESMLWDYHEPQSIPGRLRRSGLFYTGTLGGQQVAFIPADMRALLKAAFVNS